VFLLFWEPWQTYYRVFYAPALVFLAALGVARFDRVLFGSASRPAFARLTYALCLVCLGLLNLGFFIAPNMRSDSNWLIETAKRAGWGRDTVVYFADRNEADTAFEYFNPSSEWRRLSASMLDDLEGDIAATYNQGRKVWLNRGALNLVGNQRLQRLFVEGYIDAEGSYSPALYVQVAR